MSAYANIYHIYVLQYTKKALYKLPPHKWVILTIVYDLYQKAVLSIFVNQTAHSRHLQTALTCLQETGSSGCQVRSPAVSLIAL